MHVEKKARVSAVARRFDTALAPVVALAASTDNLISHPLTFSQYFAFPGSCTKKKHDYPVVTHSEKKA